MCWENVEITPLHDFKTISLGIMMTLPAYLLSGQAWNFSGLGIILIIKYRVQTVDPMSVFFSESDGPSGSFAFFKMLPVIGWRLKVLTTYWQAPLGGLPRGCRVANRLQVPSWSITLFKGWSDETCYWWFKGQPIDMHHIPNFGAGFLNHHTNHPFLVSHTQPPWKNT